jgi:SpoVK/Ycf46/Vps4 family AAA+-type ATPase
VVSPETREELETVLTKIRHHSVLYQDFGLAQIDPSGGKTAINLYGPPGTGKSFAAQAIAQHIGRRIIQVNYAELESKFVGETAKNITAAFEAARLQDAVLFFDEADSILGKRLTTVRQSTDHAVNVSRSVMLLQLDQFAGVTVFATNLAANYDSAFVRRIIAHIQMPLPGQYERLQLWKNHIPPQMPVSLSQPQWLELGEQSEGLSGGDILNCVITAASRALTREGRTCRIQLQDFLHAIAGIHRAQQAITPDT